MNKNLIYLLAIICTVNMYSQIKQLTFGSNNELNPSLSRNNSYNQFEWLTYERQTQDSSFIVVKKFWRITSSWDSTETIISKSDQNGIQKYPEVCCKTNYSIVSWQKKYLGKWNIFYSIYSYANSQWSPPIQLTNDTLNNVNVRIQSIYPDSQFIFTWQSKNVIRYAKYPILTIGLRDTIAISNYDSTEYDMMTNQSDLGSVIFTIKGTNNKYDAVVRDFSFYLKDSLYAYDTLQLSLSIRNPKFIQYYNPKKEIVFESQRIDSLNDIYIYNIKSAYVFHEPPFKVTNSENSHYNARGYFFPIVTLQTSQSIADITPYNHLIVYQASKSVIALSNRDSSFIKITNRFSTDTIQSSGFNRNPIVGSNNAYVSGGNNGIYVPVVWESNRTGYTHLYSKLSLAAIIDEVSSSEKIIHSFILSQNFPNPFNPTTRISYQLPIDNSVTLKVFDLLGKEVAILVNEKQDAGSHIVTFSGSNLSSGIYFYRLTSGLYSQTKKLILIK